MENHKFKPIPYSKLCGSCFKPKLNEMHLDFLDAEDIIVRSDANCKQ